MRYSSRFEYKYILSRSQYHLIKNELTPFLTPDYYSKIAENNRYLVQSIYYDTYSLEAFHERNDGQYGRIKLRIRSYTDKPVPNQKISFELKTKRGDSMVKYSKLVSYNDYTRLLKDAHLASDDSVLSEFFRIMKTKSLQPVLIVKYMREGFTPKDKSNLRITFDHKVSSSKANELFQENLMFNEHRPKNIILEVKCQINQPIWLQKIVKKHGLKKVTNSKYVQGIEVVRPLMITPNTVII